MRPQHVVLGVIAAAAVFTGGYLWFQKSQQSDDVKALNERIAKLEGEKTKGGGTSVVVQVNDLSTEAGRLAARQKYINDGFMLLDKQTAESTESAIAIFKEGIEKVNRQEPQFYNGLGRAYLFLHKDELAIESFRRGLRVNPRNADMHSGIGWAWWNLKDPFRAKAEWEKAIELDPYCRSALTALSWIYLSQSEFEKSKKGFQILLDSVRNNPNASPTAKAWNMGLNLAQGKNSSPEAVGTFFEVPPLKDFAAPRLEDFPPPPAEPETAPSSATSASQPASAVSRPATNP